MIPVNASAEDIIAYDKLNPHPPWGKYTDDLYTTLREIIELEKCKYVKSYASRTQGTLCKKIGSLFFAIIGSLVMSISLCIVSAGGAHSTNILKAIKHEEASYTTMSNVLNN